MKLWSNFVKELTIASRGSYFYVEVAMAFIILLLLLFVVPENFDSKMNEYLYLDFPTTSMEKSYIDAFEDLDGQPEVVTLKAGKDEIDALLYETADKKIYLLESKKDMILLAEIEHEIGAAITLGEDDHKMQYTYYLQGNETERFKSLLMIVHGQDDERLYNVAKNQEIRSLTDAGIQLTDRENLLPIFLTCNGVLMGIFIIAAYIFLDKKEGVIKAYAITPSPVWKYLLSKAMVLTTTMLLASLVIIVPLMGMRINYLILLAFLIPTGLFVSGLGLVVAGYYDSMVKSFGVMYLFMIAMSIPVLAYFMPSWDPLWLKFIPSYYIILGFKEIFIKGDMGFVLLIALGYLVTAVLLFIWSNARFNRTLSV